MPHLCVNPDDAVVFLGSGNSDPAKSEPAQSGFSNECTTSGQNEATQKLHHNQIPFWDKLMFPTGNTEFT